MKSPIPEAYVHGHLHGGPHDGETVMMPWARVEVPMLDWTDDEPVESRYVLCGPWRGQDTAHYEWIDPMPPKPARRPNLARRLLARLRTS